MRRPAIVLSLIVLGNLAAAVAPAQIPVTLQFRDSAGAPMAVRAGVFTASMSFPPQNQAAHMYQQRGGESYFYCDGSAVVSVPPGAVTIRAGRGFEYQARDTTLTVNTATTVVIPLVRLVDMTGLGAYSGDTHVHISHPPLVYALNAQDLRLVAEAEDLNFINSMEEQPYFTGVMDPVSQPNRIVYFSKEQRNAHFSHLTVLGLKQWIFDQGCVEQGIACGRTLPASIYAEVHAQPGETAVIATHPFSTFDMGDISPWPGGGMWRAMAIDLPAGAVDAMDVLTYSSAAPPAGVAPYFSALSAGFRLAPSAGTDCTLGSGQSLPAGGYRAYVFLDGAFTLDAWIAGLKAGRSFVSNYPLFTHFEIEGARPGEVVLSDEPTLHGSVSLQSGFPVSKIAIFGDTGLLKVIYPPGGPARSIAASFDIASAGLTWVVARATGTTSQWHVVSAGGLFAQTAPVYIEDGPTGQRAGRQQQGAYGTQASAAYYFLDQLDALEDVFNAYGYFPDGTRPAFDDALLFARQYFTGLVNTITGITPPALRPAWALRAVWPNPSTQGTRVDYVVPRDGGAHTIAVYDVAGRVVRRLYFGSRDAGEYALDWDGRDEHGKRVASGVYFVTIRPRAAAPVSRKLVVVH